MCGCPPGLAQSPTSLYSSDLGAATGKKERADAETPGERLALTAQQRRIMPGGPQLFDKFKCNVWL